MHDIDYYSNIRKELEDHHAPNEFNHGSMFCGSWYEGWRNARIIKLCKILGGKEWFKGKSVLELGCGHGHVGVMLKRWGADVLLTDGREWCVEATNYYWPDMDVRLVDQTKPYSLGNFDLVIHWGITYHLPPDKWKEDLKCAFGHGKKICYECEVVDWANDNFAEACPDEGLDKSLSGVGTKISTRTLEKSFRELGYRWKRYDDEDLDTGSSRYSWVEEDNGNWFPGQRRFWMLKKK